jgi:UDP-N-acetyl-D-glucosamine dehydrogenase
VAHDGLSLAINGRERQLQSKLVAFEMPDPRSGDSNGNGSGNGNSTGLRSVAIIGLGYVGLPTALALHGRCPQIIGIDVSQERLDEISARHADLSGPDRERLDVALAAGTLMLTSRLGAMTEADAVIICVPTPVDGHNTPDLTALRSACATVVAHARAGQTIILTSTTYAGTTQEMLAEPLEQRGLRVGSDVFVAFSPERIDPGNAEHLQRETPRVVGGVTPACAYQAARVIGQLTDSVYLVSSPAAAEATKLYENIFRAVSLALANEFADACRALDLDPMEVTLAAATKPYGFLGVFPGPGVGGHCIPADPHYLLWQLALQGHSSPLIAQAMKSIDLRPGRVVERAGEVLADADGKLTGARVIVVGVSYKAGVRDLRQSPAIPLLAGLIREGADVEYHDPLIPSVRLPDGQLMTNTPAPRGPDYDLAVIHTVHPDADYSWVWNCPQVLDATYKFDGGTHRSVV